MVAPGLFPSKNTVETSTSRDSKQVDPAGGLPEPGCTRSECEAGARAGEGEREEGRGKREKGRGKREEGKAVVSRVGA